MILGIEVAKKDKKERNRTTNCYDCETVLSANEAKKSPNEGDTRIFCVPHWKKRYGKKKKLIRRI